MSAQDVLEISPTSSLIRASVLHISMESPSKDSVLRLNCHTPTPANQITIGQLSLESVLSNPHLTCLGKFWRKPHPGNSCEIVCKLFAAPVAGANTYSATGFSLQSPRPSIQCEKGARLNLIPRPLLPSACMSRLLSMPRMFSSTRTPPSLARSLGRASQISLYLPKRKNSRRWRCTRTRVAHSCSSWRQCAVVCCRDNEGKGMSHDRRELQQDSKRPAEDASSSRVEDGKVSLRPETPSGRNQAATGNGL